MKLLHKTRDGYLYWCPGCKSAHHVWCNASSGPNWSFNGDEQKPTFNPSVRHFVPAQDGEPEETTCHYFIRDGMIDYCTDSQHEFAGKTIPMEPVPDNYGLGSAE